MELHKEEVKNLMATYKNEFFSVEFVKKDGSLRKMNCRFGVKKHLVSNRPSNTAHLPNYVTVYDVQSAGYRTINLTTLKTITIHKHTYTVI